jgi:predicted transcriptional regulator/GNAT superfamily N-acetyltransferase
MHANRIFQGTKRYELRRKLPFDSFERVYLYQSGGKGIVGCFDVGEVLVKPVEELWQTVGELAASEKRFRTYFEGRLIGFAVEVKNPIRFNTPLFPTELRKQLPAFTAPMSFLTLQKGSKLYEILDQHRAKETNTKEVTLRQISKGHSREYTKLVTEVISSKYDEITAGFARAALRSHRLGYDPNGIFTLRKEVLEIVAGSGTHIGYTTLTYKIGGSVKTGPTILLPRYRGKGYGAATRRAIERHASANGIRKLYCTCPDNDENVLSYLLRSGYRVEAHLPAQYRVSNGELVLGSLLKPADTPASVLLRKESVACTVTDAEGLNRVMLADFISQQLNYAGFPVGDAGAKAMAAAAISKDKKSYEDKPLQVFCLMDKRACHGLLVLIPKRGGAVKAICACSTSDPESIRSLLARGERQARDQARRKIYILQPQNDPVLTEILRGAGYRAEGNLREPYVAGLDCLVLAKLL